MTDSDVLELPKNRGGDPVDEEDVDPGEDWNVTAKQLRDRWGLDNVETIYRWAHQGKLPALKLGDHRGAPVRFRWSDVLEFEEEHRLDAL